MSSLDPGSSNRRTPDPTNGAAVSEVVTETSHIPGRLISKSATPEPFVNFVNDVSPFTDAADTTTSASDILSDASLITVTLPFVSFYFLNDVTTLNEEMSIRAIVKDGNLSANVFIGWVFFYKIFMYVHIKDRFIYLYGQQI